jgi:hypothetical protein
MVTIWSDERKGTRGCQTDAERIAAWERFAREFLELMGEDPSPVEDLLSKVEEVIELSAIRSVGSRRR